MDPSWFAAMGVRAFEPRSSTLEDAAPSRMKTPRRFRDASSSSKLARLARIVKAKIRW